jgi:hypothetical protein
MLHYEKKTKDYIMSVPKNTVDWEEDKKYIKKYTGFKGSEDEWYQNCLKIVFDDLKMDIQKQKDASLYSFFPNCATNILPDITEIEEDYYGKQFSKFGIKNKYNATSKELEKTNSKVKTPCLFCKTVGLPAIHPASWVKFYRGKSGDYIPGRCKFQHKVETRMRKPHHFNGCIGDFSERIVIEAYKHEGLYVPSKASIVEEYYSKTNQCYITGETAVDPQKEHLHPSARGHAYIVYDRDGTYINNIMKASKTSNQSKSDTMPEEFLSEERYEAALKSNNIKKIPETLADGRNAYAVELVRKHKEKLIEYVNKERVHKEAKIRWIENFIR